MKTDENDVARNKLLTQSLSLTSAELHINCVHWVPRDLAHQVAMRQEAGSCLGLISSSLQAMPLVEKGHDFNL